MPANEYTFYNSPFAVLQALAMRLAALVVLAAVAFILPSGRLSIALCWISLVFSIFLLIPLLTALLDRRPKLTLSPKGLFIHTKFSETPLGGADKPYTRKEVFYAWHNLSLPTIAAMSLTLVMVTDDMLEFAETLLTSLPDNATEEQAEAELAKIDSALTRGEGLAETVNGAQVYILSFPILALPHGKRLPQILQSLIDAKGESERLAIIQRLIYQP